ncbi:hypothetical protein [Phaeacidiphilus oryzae]|jgi:hypothetical protein|uniref:hypothetical protein n=1 Tax=Phaeacidiphilus oryzae TaxID=348818 RepID=UPI00056B0469|nr:hypothetical protein [Phaeacidiphilus oryzae]
MRDQIETREISDADLDAVAGGLGPVTSTVATLANTAEGALPQPLSGLVGTVTGTVLGAAAPVTDIVGL